jgi:hypothetical protein
MHRDMDPACITLRCMTWRFAAGLRQTTSAGRQRDVLAIISLIGGRCRWVGECADAGVQGRERSGMALGRVGSTAVKPARSVFPGLSGFPRHEPFFRAVRSVGISRCDIHACQIAGLMTRASAPTSCPRAISRPIRHEGFDAQVHARYKPLHPQHHRFARPCSRMRLGIEPHRPECRTRCFIQRIAIDTCQI